MVELDKKRIAGLLLLTSFISGLAGDSLTYEGQAYYCESRNLVCIGSRLSSTGKTCYWLADGEEKAARCTEGWEPYKMSSDKPGLEAYIYANNCLHTCPYTESLKSYDICTCDNGQFAYAGELI